MTKNESGQTLFELLMAIAVGSIVITALVAITTLSIRNASFAKQNAQATRYSQEAIEWLREERDKDWTSFLGKSSDTTQYYCLTSLSWPQTGNCTSTQYITNTIFKREISLISRNLDGNPGNETVEAIVTVVWVDSLGSHTSTLSTQLTNWETEE